MTYVRPEISDDIEKIDEIYRRAFETDLEANLVKTIRGSEYFIPELSLVAVKQTRVVGHILFSGIKIIGEGGEIPVLALAPMAVLPEYQRQAIGSELVYRGLLESAKLGYNIVVVIGHPAYYPKFGFKPARQYGIRAPFDVPDEAFLVLELKVGALKDLNGVVTYNPAFNSAI